MRILLIEDDAQLGKALYQGLKQEYAADWFTSAEEGEDALTSAQYDLIILDINLPGMSGLEWLKNLRRRKQHIPVLLLTARDTPRERIEGLDTGADDYLVKPFDFDELLARIRALSRRREAYHPAIITFGELTLDTQNKTVNRNKDLLDISRKEFEILRLLVEHPGRYISKEKMEQNLYNWEETIGSNTIEVHISSLRRKLGKDLIRTVRNLGYKVNPV